MAGRASFSASSIRSSAQFSDHGLPHPRWESATLSGMVSDAVTRVRLHVAPCTQIIPFWHIDTPAGTAAEIRLRAAPEAGAGFSPWVSLARWSSAEPGVSTTLPDQHVHGLRTDADTVTVETTELGGSARVVDLEVRAVPVAEVPVAEANPAAASGAETITVHWIDALTGPAAPPRSEITASAPGGRDIDHRLPAISQHACGTLEGYAQADSWCSPTALTMVMEWLTGTRAGADIAGADVADRPANEDAPARVQPAILGVWDTEFAGAGNWAFNVAWANTCGFDARLDSLDSLREAEELLATGEVLIASVTFTTEQLPEAGYPTNGHLLIISGVTAEGDVRVHDPGRAIADGVRTVYPREAFEKAWLSAEGSGGLVYRIRNR